jgi:hypothetical protein
MVLSKMDLIIINLMLMSSILVLMHHKFGVNASNLVLMPKKISGGGYYNFFFFLNYVLCKTGRTSGEPTGRTPSIFHLDNLNNVD